MGKRPQKKRKVELVFDEKKRREYLSGFRKRKQERRKKAREDLEIQVKEEQKRIKQESREDIRNKLKRSFAPIPELENELNEEEYETEDVSVKIVEISTSELAKTNNWIGENRPKYSDDEDESIDEVPSKEAKANYIPGMDLTISEKKPQKPKDADDEVDVKKTKAADFKLYKSKKDLERNVQKDAMRTLKSSKAFQLKRKMDQLKDRKKARLNKDRRKKIHNKEARKNGGKVNPRKLKKKFKGKRS